MGGIGADNPWLIVAVVFSVVVFCIGLRLFYLWYDAQVASIKAHQNRLDLLPAIDETESIVRMPRRLTILHRAPIFLWTLYLAALMSCLIAVNLWFYFERYADNGLVRMVTVHAFVVFWFSFWLVLGGQEFQVTDNLVLIDRHMGLRIYTRFAWRICGCKGQWYQNTKYPIVPLNAVTNSQFYECHRNGYSIWKIKVMNYHLHAGYSEDEARSLMSLINTFLAQIRNSE